jgi:hypothetical protein
LSAADNEARFDHNPTTSESLGLLIEEQRTNLFERSEEFDNADWIKSNATITANTVVAPDGALSGDLITTTTTGGFNGRVTQTASLSVGVTATLSFYAKKSNSDWVSATISMTGTKARRCWWNIATGVIGGTTTASAGGETLVSHTIKPVGNGWYFCAMTVNPNLESLSSSQFIQSSIANTNSTAAAGDAFFLWGAQLEAGAFPTSYIPTVASQVTRSADAASMTGTNFSSWYRADEGSMYAEWQKFAPSTFQAVAMASDGTGSNVVAIGHGSIFGGNNSLRLDVTAGGTNQASITTIANSPSNTFAKTAAAYAVNDFSVVSNGGSAGTDTSGVLPVVNRFSIGANAAGTGTFLNGTIKKLAFYPLRLQNAELQALTEV